jgi:hypothetical protein
MGFLSRGSDVLSPGDQVTEVWGYTNLFLDVDKRAQHGGNLLWFQRTSDAFNVPAACSSPNHWPSFQVYQSLHASSISASRESNLRPAAMGLPAQIRTRPFRDMLSRKSGVSHVEMAIRHCPRSVVPVRRSVRGADGDTSDNCSGGE